jgi:hypothetical protein
MSKRSAWTLVAVLVLAWPTAARGQTLSDLLPRLLSEAVTMPSTTGAVAGNPHEAHFLPAAAQLQAPYALNGAVVSQLATFPIGSSSGGFTYTFDEKTGIPQRSSGNFGPAFAERALTNGKGKLNVGMNYQHVSYDKFEGLGLGGDVRFYLQHNDCCPLQLPDGTPNPAGILGPSQDVNPFFEGDLVKTTLSLDVRTDTAAFFANYGVADWFDFGFVVPVVRVKLDATMNSELIRLATGANPTIHSFGAASPNAKVSTESGSASGLGDVLLRGKLRVLESAGGGLALGADVRLPTGDKDNLLGTGATQAKASLIYSADFGRVSPHINVGYTYSSGSVSSGVATYRLGDEKPVPLPTAPNAYDTVFRGNTPNAPTTGVNLNVPDEINYTAGFVVSASPRLSLSATLVGRTLREVTRFAVRDKSFGYRTTTNGVLQTVSTNDGLDVTTTAGDLTLLLGVAGFKLNVGKTLLLNANVLFPLNDNGLRPKTTAVVGLDYAF